LSFSTQTHNNKTHKGYCVSVIAMRACACVCACVRACVCMHLRVIYGRKAGGGTGASLHK